MGWDGETTACNITGDLNLPNTITVLIQFNLTVSIIQGYNFAQP